MLLDKKLMQIRALDLGFQETPRVTASYLVVGPDGPVLVETGPGSTLDNLTGQLAAAGYSPSDIRHVLVTHIHLDHAGAAGWWAQQGAQVYVHHVGAPHLIDPGKLLASASRIYGDQMFPLWGEMLPAPAERVTPVFDGDTIAVAGLTFTAMDTPGHAYHHHVYRLGDIAFTGDAAGIHLPELSMADLPAPPPEFNLDRWLTTVERLQKESFSAIYPTHFGKVSQWRQHLATFAALLKDSAEFVRVRMEEGLERDDIVHRYRSWQGTRAKEAQVSDETLQWYEVVNPLYMSVDGIMRYWRKKDSVPL
jgi:glyoxylase-like metal-dependent hydrolase (beta-lactamase superfamily II)